MRHPISRRLVVTAAVLALAAWGSAPRSLRAAPASGLSLLASQDADFLAPLRQWLRAIWPWNGSEARRDGVRHDAAVAKPQNRCTMDPDGQCTTDVKPQNRCVIDPDGQCITDVKPQNRCGADPNGGQQCTAAVTPQNRCTADPDGHGCLNRAVSW